MAAHSVGQARGQTHEMQVPESSTNLPAKYHRVTVNLLPQEMHSNSPN